MGVAERECEMILVVRNCKDCPFCVDRDGRMFCNVSTPKKREILLEDERPNFCKLRRESVIVKEAG